MDFLNDEILKAMKNEMGDSAKNTGDTDGDDFNETKSIVKTMMSFVEKGSIMRLSAAAAEETKKEIDRLTETLKKNNSDDSTKIGQTVYTIIRSANKLKILDLIMKIGFVCIANANVTEATLQDILQMVENDKTM